MSIHRWRKPMVVGFHFWEFPGELWYQGSSAYHRLYSFLIRAVTTITVCACHQREVSIYQPSCGQSDGPLLAKHLLLGTIEYKHRCGVTGKAAALLRTWYGIFFLIPLPRRPLQFILTLLSLLSKHRFEIWSVVIERQYKLWECHRSNNDCCLIIWCLI